MWGAFKHREIVTKKLTGAIAAQVFYVGILMCKSNWLHLCVETLYVHRKSLHKRNSSPKCRNDSTFIEHIEHICIYCLRCNSSLSSTLLDSISNALIQCLVHICAYMYLCCIHITFQRNLGFFLFKRCFLIENNAEENSVGNESKNYFRVKWVMLNSCCLLAFQLRYVLVWEKKFHNAITNARMREHLHQTYDDLILRNMTNNEHRTLKKRILAH